MNKRNNDNNNNNNNNNKQIENNDVNGSRLAEQGPSSGRCSRQGNTVRHHANPVISKRRKWSSQENKIVMECYLLREPKVRGYRKRMLRLWLNKGMSWVSEQKLVDQENTIRRNSWMTDLGIEELERNLAETDSCKEEERSADDTGNNLGERDFLTALEADEEIGNLIEEIAEMLEKRQKDKLPALRDIPKKKLLEEIAKVGKVLFKFKTHSITRTNELFYAGAVVVTDRLGVKINKAAERKEPMWRRWFQNKIKQLSRALSQLEPSKDKEVSNVRHWQTLERKYSIRVKTLGVVIEGLKQRIVATAVKIRRYQERVAWFR